MTHEPFDDPVLGHVAWSAAESCWKFEAGPIDGRSVPARYDQAAYEQGDNRSLPAADQRWDGIRACIRWVRANEPAARAYMTERLYQGWLEAWYEEEIDQPTTPEAFREQLQLTGIGFYDSRHAQRIDNDGNLFGGHGFVLEVDPAGQFTSGPDMFG